MAVSLPLEFIELAVSKWLKPPKLLKTPAGPNIALINELAIIFEHVGIDTMEVLDVARTKWNFFV